MHMLKHLIFWALLMSACIGNAADTLHVCWKEQLVEVQPHKMRGVTFCNDSLSYVSINVNRRKPIVISISGSTTNGGLRLESRNECTLYFNSVQITSTHGPAIDIRSKQKVTFEIGRGTDNMLQDSASYKKAIYGSAACIHANGPIEVSGDGSIHVFAKKRHGIVTDSTFVQKGGRIDLHTYRKGAKGINCKQFELQAGHLCGEGTSDIMYKDSVLTYSSLVKSQQNMIITGGQVNLSHLGAGSRCMTCGDTLFLKGGQLSLEATGNGGYFSHKQRGRHYWNVRDYRQYYSARCIKARVGYLERGQISCLSTGSGGKGIDIDDYLQTGSHTDTLAQQGPTITIETRGDCIYDDKIFDQRDGCPKSIRARYINMYSGNADIKTFAMGGEGVECDSLAIWHPHLVCNTFDDGINVNQDIEIHGGEVYCNSRDNDGIDSNGSIHILGGIVASISQHNQNESLDAENNQVVISGGTIFGIGNSTVKMQSTTMPIYNAVSEKEGRLRPTLHIQSGSYLCIVQNNSVLMTLKNTDTNDHASVIALWPEFRSGQKYQLIATHCPPTDFEQSYFDGNLLFGGTIDRSTDIQLLEEFTANPWVFKEMRGKNRNKEANK